MAEKTDDETPPVETESQKVPEETTPPEPVQTAQEHHEEIPEWGKALTGMVESLSNAVSSLVEAPKVEETPPEPDESPKPTPWHKRGFGRS